ncbi:MAG: hypothetical protein V4598_19810 [Bdellovibrionota bacterium]
MGLNKTMILALVAFSTTAWSSSQYDQTKFYEITKVEVKEISRDIILDQDVQRTMSEVYLGNSNLKSGANVESAGKIISVARDLVALGEDIYRLVSKGKPNVTTAYDPISVIPRVNGAPVDILDTESWTMPTKRTYGIALKNTYGIEVVTFRYSIIFSYNGKYNDTGAYLTAAQIQPDYVNVLWGFDFSATMKLGGIVNQGTRANPIAGATLIMQYTSSNIINSRTMTDTYFINGRGQFRKL